MEHRRKANNPVDSSVNRGRLRLVAEGSTVAPHPRGWVEHARCASTAGGCSRSWWVDGAGQAGWGAEAVTDGATLGQPISRS